MTWRTINGVPIQGSLLLPPARFRPPYPLIVYVYPFGTSNDYYPALVDQFGLGSIVTGPSEDMQLLAPRGYAVLRPDHTPMAVSGRERAGIATNMFS